MADRVRIDIAFEGGMSLAVSVPSSVAVELDNALADPGTESFAFEAEDGHYMLALNKIVFIKRSQREQVVGFGAIEAAS